MVRRVDVGVLGLKVSSSSVDPVVTGHLLVLVHVVDGWQAGAS